MFDKLRKYFCKSSNVLGSDVDPINQKLIREVEDLALELSCKAKQYQTQLNGCLVAAEGSEPKRYRAKSDDYGWSVAYQAVCDLRDCYDALANITKPTGKPRLGRNYDGWVIKNQKTGKFICETFKRYRQDTQDVLAFNDPKDTIPVKVRLVEVK